MRAVIGFGVIVVALAAAYAVSFWLAMGLAVSFLLVLMVGAYAIKRKRATSNVSLLLRRISLLKEKLNPSADMESLLLSSVSVEAYKHVCELYENNGLYRDGEFVSIGEEARFELLETLIVVFFVGNSEIITAEEERIAKQINKMQVEFFGRLAMVALLQAKIRMRSRDLEGVESATAVLRKHLLKSLQNLDWMNFIMTGVTELQRETASHVVDKLVKASCAKFVNDVTEWAQEQWAYAEPEYVLRAQQQGQDKMQEDIEAVMIAVFRSLLLKIKQAEKESKAKEGVNAQSKD